MGGLDNLEPNGDSGAGGLSGVDPFGEQLDLEGGAGVPPASIGGAGFQPAESGAMAPRPERVEGSLHRSHVDSGPIDLTGLDLNGLLIVRKLGAGGMGEVWLAHDEDLDIQVAVKVLPPHLAADPGFVIRFLREARAVAKLDHPNIVRVLQAGRREAFGQYLRLMVMEYVDGQDAHELVKTSAGRRLEPQRCAEIALACAKALKYAHGQGIIHRDVKPANVLISKDGESIKLLDFGLARLAVKGEATGGSTTGNILGTPQYMPPEQCEGKIADGRADIYSLGITLYELLTGSLPFTGDTVFSIIEGHVRKPLELPVDAFKSVPVVFHELIRGMCEKKPDDRTPLKQIIEKLEAFIHGSRPSLLTSRTSMVESEVQAKAKTNLLERKNSFVGRQAEIAAIGALLAEPKTSLVTVVGPGGVGKTRITQEFGLMAAEGGAGFQPAGRFPELVEGSALPLASSRAERGIPHSVRDDQDAGGTHSTRSGQAPALQQFPGGVWFCDLTECRTADGIAGAVALGLGIPLTQNDGVGQLAASLSMREPLLLILDNFEQVVEHAGATVGVWMAKAPKAKFLASSREPLHLEGEKSFPLHPLKQDGIQLFIDRASDVKRGFTTDDATRAAIVKIVDHLDGIPLAIELAASRCSAMPPQKILERLPRRFDLLKGRRQDASARQATLRGAIDWSWDLLKPYERTALAQCSVFQGGFFLEAAEAVVNLDEHEDAPFAMDVIESLVEKSLLVAFEVPFLKGEARYRMYESIRQYGQEKLMEHESGVESLLLRHAEHYLEYAEHWNEATYGPDVVEALNRIELEYDNLFGIQEVFEETQPELAARAVLYAANTLRTRGPWKERIPRLERAVKGLGGGAGVPPAPSGQDDSSVASRLRRDVEAPRRPVIAGSLRGNPEDGVHPPIMVDEGVHSLSDTYLPLLIRLAHALTYAYFDGGSTEGLKAAANTCRELASRLANLVDSETRELACLAAQAQVLSHSRVGEFRQAGEVFDSQIRAMGLEDGRAGLQSVGFDGKLRRAVAVMVGNRGIVHMNLGEYPQALACYAEAEAINRELGNRAVGGINVGNRGNVHLNLGEYPQALACLAEAEAIARELGNRAGVAVTIGNRGNVHAAIGEYPQALACYAEAEAIDRELGNREGVARHVSNRGSVHPHLGEYPQAMACYAEAEAIARELGNRALVATNVGNRGIVHMNLGEYPLALACYEEVEAIARELGNRSQLGEVLQSRADTRLLQWQAAPKGDLAWLTEAKSAVEEARSLYEHLGQQRTAEYFQTLAVLGAVEKKQLEIGGTGNHAGVNDSQAGMPVPPSQAGLAVPPEEWAQKAMALAAELPALKLGRDSIDLEIKRAWRWIDMALGEEAPGA